MTKKVLIIDSDRECLLLYKKFISKSVSVVYTASSIEEGLNIFGISLPSVLIINSELEGFDAFEFIDIVRDKFIGMIYEIVLILDKMDKNVYKKAIDYNINKILIKPVNATSLIFSTNNAFNIYNLRIQVKEDEKNKHDSEQLYKTLIDTSSDSVIVTDINGKIILCNQEAVISNGYKDTSDLNGYSIYDIIKSTKNSHPFSEFMETILKERHLNNVLVHIKKSDGTYYDGEINASVASDDFNNVKYIIFIATDVTKSLKIERDLTINTRVLTFSNFPIVITDALKYGNPVVFVNPAFYEKTGYSESDIIGKNCNILQGTDTDQPEIQIIKDAIKNKSKVEVTLRNYKKSGEMFYNEVRISPVFDSDGVVTNYLGMSNDITKKRKMEMALVESERRYKILAENFPNGIVILIDEYGKILIIDGQSMNKFKFKKNELEQSNIYEMIKMYPYLEVISPLIQRVLLGTYNSIKINFKKLVFKCSAFPIKGNNEHYNGLIVIRDITTQVRHENLMESNLKQKETLLKEVHHRIKNNLQIVQSLLDLQISMSDYDNGFYKILKNKLEDAKSRIRAISNIHKNLYKSLTLDSIDYKEYVEELLHDLIESYYSDTNITYNLKMDNIQLSLDYAIPIALIINEIYSNSIKHAFIGNTGHISIEFKKENKMYILKICDNGIGISKDIDLNNVETLGISLIKGLTEQMHGTINIKIDNGTSFEIIIPTLQSHQNIL